MDTDKAVTDTIIIHEEEGRQELKTQFIELRAKGLSYQKISRRLKVSKSTLANWSAELEGEIASLRAMELEALYERHYLTKEARIKLLGDQVRAIQEELKTRSLDQVSTEKLLEMELKMLQALKEEHVEVRPLSDYERSVLKDGS
jgi:transposase